MQEIRFDQLDHARRLRLAWALVWPPLILGVLAGGLKDNLGLTPEQLDPVDFCLQAVFLFLILPWTVRRSVRLSFPGFHLLVNRHSGDETRAMNYNESLRVAWLLAWRIGTVLGIVVLLIYVGAWVVRGVAPDNPFRDVAHPGLEGLVNGLFQSILEAACNLILLVVWMIQAALNKEYSDFRLKLAAE